MLKLTSSCFVIDSPRNKKAIIVANRGDVLFRNATFESEINFIAMLKTKKVIVPEKALTRTNFH
jgi:hypothetical protein